MRSAFRIFRFERPGPAAPTAAAGLRADRANWRLYQFPIFTRMKIANSAASANHPIEACPNGITINAASRGPKALPALPPTWKIDCASPLRPPEASWATREDSGWKTDEPQPISPTDTRISENPGAAASASSPHSVKHIPTASE